MIRAEGFAPTTRALWDLGLSTGPLGPMDFTVEMEEGFLVLASRKRAERFLELPAGMRDPLLLERTRPSR